MIEYSILRSAADLLAIAASTAPIPITKGSLTVRSTVKGNGLLSPQNGCSDRSQTSTVKITNTMVAMAIVVLVCIGLMPAEIRNKSNEP